MSSARVVRRGKSKPVKNLGWFFREARSNNIIEDFSMARIGKFPSEWRMKVVFRDGTTFHSNYTSLDVFKDVMGRQQSLKGVPVTIFDGDESYTITLGRC